MVDMAIYLVSALLLLAGAYLVFGILVRRDYQQRSRLTPLSSFLELVIWMLYFFFPYLYNPSDWALVWFGDIRVSQALTVVGSALLVIGIAIAAASMVWLGIRKSFGRNVVGLQAAGPYRFCRNPQIVGGALMVTGVSILWPSWYALGWAAMYGAIAHMMVRTEEEHLVNVFGQEYVNYRQRVPRYLGIAKPDGKHLDHMV